MGASIMLIVTTNEIAGKKITSVKGLVQGSTVKAKHVGRDIGAGIKTLVGGEITGYSELMKDARVAAKNRVNKEADEIGANTIVEMRYQTSQVMNGASEVIASGTDLISELRRISSIIRDGGDIFILKIYNSFKSM